MAFARALRDSVLNIITGCRSIVPHHDAFGTNDNKGRTLVTKPTTDFRFNLPACDRHVAFSPPPLYTYTRNLSVPYASPPPLSKQKVNDLIF